MGTEKEEVKDEFVESIEFVPENFLDSQDKLPSEFVPEIADEKRKVESPEEPPAMESSKGEETPPVEGEKKEDEEVDEPPEIDPVALKTELEEVKARLKKAEARAGYYQRRAEKKTPEKSIEEAQTPLEKPKYEDFKTDEEYFDALTDYKVEMKLREQDKQKAEQAREAETQTLQSWILEMSADGAARFDDFEEIVTDPIVPLSEQILKSVRQCDKENVSASEIVYYLGKNIRETAKISRLNPEAVTREIGAIAEKIAASKVEPQEEESPKAPPKPKPKEITKAPPPITPIRGASAPVSKDPEKMTNEEYRAMRRAQGRR